MIPKLPSSLLAAGLLLAAGRGRAAEEPAWITLPVRFHVVEGVTMTVKDHKLDPWVAPEALRNTVLPEVNRIWAPARIRFTIERCRREALLAPDNRDELIRIVENAKRSDPPARNRRRVQSIDQLLDPAERHPTALNVYLLPFIGSTYQGYARLGGRQAVVGVWTDKPSGGKRPPDKVLLVEPEPFQVGSLARTIAHELGHNLGLTHPPKDLPNPTPRLMGGRRHGYGLTADEIDKARKQAEAHRDVP